MRNPNGYGGVSKLSGNRRKPYVARVTKEFDENDKQKYITIGYYAKQTEAIMALAEYNKAPTTKIGMTLKQLYDEWCETRAFIELSKDTQNNYTASWNKRLLALGSEKVKEIRTGQLQGIINKAENDNMSKSSMKKDKVLMVILFDYALQNDIVHKNYAKFVEIPSEVEISTKDAFTDIELAKIEKAVKKIPFADIVLMLCYTGFRIQELLNLTQFSYDEKNKTLTGGMKTEAGKDRVIPIHPKIEAIVKKWASKKGDTIICKENGKPYLVRYFRNNCYKPAIKSIGGVRNLLPHCCRHTFATMLHNKDVDPLDIEFLLGHASYTQSKKYTHSQIDRLKNAVNVL